MIFRYSILIVATLSSVWEVNVAVETIDCATSQSIKVGSTPTVYRYGDGSTPYPITTSCSFVLEALDPNATMVLNPLFKCGGGDVIKIHDGINQSGDELFSGCCFDCIKTPRTSTGNVLYVSFQSDGTSDPKELGFDLQVIAGTDQSFCPNGNESNAFTVGASPIIISSPNFPAIYPKNRDCKYTFTPADASQGIKISFDTISLDHDEGLCYDEILLRKDSVSGDLISKICEYEQRGLALFPNETRTIEGTLFLRFRSDALFESIGFRAIIQQAGTTTETTTGNSLSTTQQDLTSAQTTSALTTSALTTQETSPMTTEKATSTEEQTLTTTLIENTSSTDQQSTTEDNSIPLAITCALIGITILLSINIIVCKCAKGRAVEDILVLSAIQVYKETRFGIAKGYFHCKSLNQGNQHIIEENGGNSLSTVHD